MKRLTYGLVGVGLLLAAGGLVASGADVRPTPRPQTTKAPSLPMQGQGQGQAYLTVVNGQLGYRKP